MYKTVYATFDSIDMAELATNDIKNKNLYEERIIITSRESINKENTYNKDFIDNNFLPILPTFSTGTFNQMNTFNNINMSTATAIRNADFYGEHQNNNVEEDIPNNNDNFILLTKVKAENTALVSSILRKYRANKINIS